MVIHPKTTIYDALCSFYNAHIILNYPFYLGPIPCLTPIPPNETCYGDVLGNPHHVIIVMNKQ